MDDITQDVFILGAGFSRAVSSHMPTLPELSGLVRERVPALDGTRVTAMFPDNLELWLTYLSQDHPWLSEVDNLRNRALALETGTEIRTILQNRTDRLQEGKCPDWLTQLLDYWFEHRSKVLTLNYDVLVEGTAALRGRVADCSDLYPIVLTPAVLRSGAIEGGPPASPGLQLFKLHGSVNWFYSGSSSFFGETLYFCQVDSIWDPAETSGGSNQWAPVDDKVPFVVPPITEKTHYFQHGSLRSLWRKAGVVLRAARRVFCLGYSLPQTDLTVRFLLSNAVPKADAQIPFYVVNKDTYAPKHFHDVLPKGYRVIDSFVGNDPIADFTQALVEGSLPKQES